MSHFAFFTTFVAIALVAASASADTPDEDKKGWAALPGISYGPENGLTLAASALVYRSLEDSKNARRSELVASAAISFAGYRRLSLAPDLWFFDGKYNLAFKLKGSQEEHAYFGVGNGSALADREDYEDLSMGLRGNLSYLVTEDILVGVVYDLQFQQYTELEPGGSVEALVGEQDAKTFDSGAGVEVQYDTRNTGYWPTLGTKSLARIRGYAPAIGSDDRFVAFYTQTTSYREVHPGHVLAGEVQGEYRSRGARFDALALAGGDRLMRGMLRGRYRDHLFIGAQLEYRYPIAWRIGGVAFAGLGQVAGGPLELGITEFKYSVGGGLRLRINDAGVRVRADFGASDGATGFYLNLLEAF